MNSARASGLLLTALRDFTRISADAVAPRRGRRHPHPLPAAHGRPANVGGASSSSAEHPRRGVSRHRSRLETRPDHKFSEPGALLSSTPTDLRRSALRLLPTAYWCGLDLLASRARCERQPRCDWLERQGQRWGIAGNCGSFRSSRKTAARVWNASAHRRTGGFNARGAVPRRIVLPRRGGAAWTRLVPYWSCS